MNAVGLIQRINARNSRQGERNECYPVTARQVSECHTELASVARAEVGRRFHTQEKDLRRRRQVARGVNDSLNILPHRFHGEPPKAVVRPCLDYQYLNGLA